ncbi:MAG: hypothetical protein H2172_14040 [Opitutus sp.]|nr:hypothetical protein [Opitutus sp.]MCS6248462.1 hypothetical protein [Opitutus sp.]MCS6274444.1 hypothetical protein [Opitutus sp.]MCS6277600.1 hypothetical protein [Opitutus sp.]MCS6300718.1 hypothetical protein [Opitutus sp.]
MPKSSDRLALTRQWHLLRKIPTYGVGLTINELKDLLSSQGIEVTKRTVERDLCYLANPRGGGWPIQVDVQSKPYRWKWLNSKGVGLPGLEIADAVAATLAKDIVHQLLPATLAETLKPKFEQAQRVLEANQSKNRFAQWADNVRYLPPSLPFLPPTVSEGVRKGVHEGLLKGLQLAVRYDSPDRTEYNDSILHPLGLIQKGPVAYLVATTLDYYPDVL